MQVFSARSREIFAFSFSFKDKKQFVSVRFVGHEVCDTVQNGTALRGGGFYGILITE